MKRLTQNEFAAICEEYGIHPAIALECEDIVGALRDCNRDLLRLVLSEEF